MFLPIIITLLIVPIALQAQEPQQEQEQPAREQAAQEPAAPAGGDEMITIGEFRIEVQAEEPTVLLTIPRQEPSITNLSLQSPLERMIAGSPATIKPDLSQMSVKKIDEAKIILANSQLK